MFVSLIRWVVINWKMRLIKHDVEEVELEMPEKKQQHEEGRSLPVRREEGRIRPFEEWTFESPFGIMRRIRDEIDRMFSDFGFPTFSVPTITSLERTGVTYPAIDVWETDQDVMVRADLPGVNPDDVQIYTTDDTLRISAESRHEEERSERGYYRTERRYGQIERVIDLPTNIKPGDAKATFKHGVLEVTLPKTEQAKEHMRRIPVQVEQEQVSGAKGGEGTEEKRGSRKTK